MRLECPPNSDSTRRPLRPQPVQSSNQIEDADDLPSPYVAHLSRHGLSLFASVLVHCLFVIVLGLITLSGYQGDILPGEEVQLGELPGAISLDVESEQFEVDVSDSKREQISETEIVAPVATVEESEQLSIDAPSIQAAGGEQAISTDGVLTNGGSGASGSASFMGVQAYGRRFCIIADRSGSMKGEPLRHLKGEVRKTLDTMSRGSAIHIVFYANSWSAFPEGWADPRSRRSDADEWLSRIISKGGTNPGPSFDHAFNLSPPPDAIFFMTDGKIPRNMDRFVSSLNDKRRKKIPVHTIAFLNRGAADIMQRIAKESGGKYRFVGGF